MAQLEKKSRGSKNSSSSRMASDTNSPAATFSDNSSSSTTTPTNNWFCPTTGFTSFVPYPQFTPLTQSLGATENAQFVGFPPSLSSFAPPVAPFDKGAQSQQNQDNIVDIDDEDTVAPNKTGKTKNRMHWTHDEEVKLASAWLNNSNDPIDGNSKKTDKFWAQVADEYNNNVSVDRRRQSNQLKQHWHKLKVQISHFNGCWTRTAKRHGSGMSDDQMMDEALKLYEAEKGKAFTLIHWWRKLKNQPKWNAHIELMENDRNKSSTDNPSQFIDLENMKNMERPIGRDVAKAERSGKRKSSEVIDGVTLLGEKIDKVIEAHDVAKQERQKMTELQQRLSSEKVEAARLELLAAKEKKEAKMFEVYNSLLTQDTSQMTSEEKASRDKALERLRIKVLGDDI